MPRLLFYRRPRRPGWSAWLIVSSFLVFATLCFSSPQDKTLATASARQANPHNLSPELERLLKDSWALHGTHQDDAAKEGLTHALAKAREESNVWAEAESHRLLGLLALNAAKYPDAQSELERALELFESAQSPSGIARSHEHLGAVLVYMGKRIEGVELYRKALAEFEALHDLTAEAQVLQNLSTVDTLPAAEKGADLERGLSLARELGNKSLEGQILHSIGDGLFSQGEYAQAIEKLKEAAAAYEEAADRDGLSTVWTSLGRLYRAHGAYEEAIAAYKKGFSIQESSGDKVGMIQSLNAMAISYGLAGQDSTARDTYERALELARASGSPRVLAFMAGNVGCTYSDNRETARRAIDLLQESLSLDPASVWKANRYLCLSGAYQSLRQQSKALENAEQAVEISRQTTDLDIRCQALKKRSDVYRDLGKYSEALSDTQEAIGLLEQLRAKLVPADFLKQGYVTVTQEYFEDAVALHEQLGQHQEAMVVAEQARARAFLDLLATRSFGKESSGQTNTASTKPSSDSSTAAAANGKDSETPVAIATRGAGALQLTSMPGAPVISSAASVAPPDFDEMVAVVKRLDSTLLSFWVNPKETFVWLLRPDGTIRSERIAVSSERIARLIRATSYGGQEPPPETRVTPATTPKSGMRTSVMRGAPALKLRGGGELVLSGHVSESWHELYKILIEPVHDSLPPRGSHLTIVPHGPLFLLSFAALQDAQGHYLVENYALNYGPSLGVLRLTEQRKQQLGQREPRYLIVADPQIEASSSKGTELPPLPGARVEAARLYQLLPRSETSVLLGPDATKRAVLQQATGKTVLHLATHAIIRDDEPWESFLALGSADESVPSDGRLGAQEIYSLQLQTDLVVLSACRTAVGKVSGDGMAGLTRAFFYGGAPSVMATLWDVADEPTSSLISEFYKALLGHADKSESLRIAQLRLIRQLRANRVRVKTPLGPVTLPEDPVFWAGFVLQGEP